LSRKLLKLGAGFGIVVLLLAGGLLASMLRPYPNLSRPDAESIRTSIAPRTPPLIPEYRDGPDAPIVVLMLFDGLAPSLVKALPTPALDRMRREGAWTHQMLPVFPSLSLPNHVSLSTGCLPARHGIVANRFIDPGRGLDDNSKDADWLLACEGLHEVAERQGVRTTALSWIGSRSATRGDLAHDVRSWPHEADDVERAKDVATLLSLPEGERPRLILSFFHGPDYLAHMSGMESEATRHAVFRADRAVALVLEAIERNDLRDRTTLLVTTDHGLRTIDQNVNARRILRRLGIDGISIGSGAVTMVYLDDPASAQEAARKLSVYDPFETHTRDAQPDWSQLGQGPRVGDLILVAKPAYVIHDENAWPWYIRWKAWLGPDLIEMGGASHGYPPNTPGIAGVFYGWGAGVPYNRRLGSFDIIDVHPTVARLLGIEAGTPVDGVPIEGLASFSQLQRE
jgi:arylsulfatase A-like enzyme